MMKPASPKLSLFQAGMLVIVGILPTAILTIPSGVIHYSRESAWMSLLLSTGCTMLAAWLIGRLIDGYEGLTLFELLRKRLGSVVTGLIGVLLAVYYMVSLVDILHQFIDFVGDKLINRTPHAVVCLIIMAVVVYAVDRGLAVISHVSTIFICSSFIAMFVSWLLLSNLMHPSWSLPLVAAPASRIVQGGIAPLGWLSEIALLLLIAPELRQPEKAKKVAYIAAAVCGLTVIAITVVAVMIMGPDIPPLLNYPSFSIVGIVEIGEFMQRVDLLFISFWTGTMFLKTAMHYFGCLYCLKEALRLVRPRTLYFPLSCIACQISVQTPIAVYKVFSLYNLYSQFFNVAFPGLIMLAAAVARRVRRG
ncbi:GerAB/ArcD/ProY family transporter [Paenibacillus hamazuiensis]|uniref:GerAB/ArcD/ProY family transporter n=1 Tax=Paenibacillus hamazuiensis TaxID=2936508 RepID=UPI00200C1F5A|nr:endospore germination permease [Paenibacillus hamazuiensis]